MMAHRRNDSSGRKGKGKKVGGGAASDTDLAGMNVMCPDAAGMDVGSKSHWVCAPNADRTGRDVSEFNANTPGLEEMVRWLKARGVVSVAMESTGVYWVAPLEVLKANGIEALLVDARELARVPGRKKTDREDCRWIQRLHTCGLLKAAFRPEEDVSQLRSMVRERGSLSDFAADCLRRMQKAMDEMNVRVHRAVSEIDGATGMAIIRAIVAGERDPAKLAALRDPHCHKTQEQMAAEMAGHWRNDHLLALGQWLAMYDGAHKSIARFDAEILLQLGRMERGDMGGKEAPELANAKKGRAIEREGLEPTRDALYRALGHDPTTIDAVGVRTAEVVVSEYGTTLERFPTEHHFVSHIGLAPRRGISGGRPVRKKATAAATRVAGVLRMAASSMRNSPTALGAHYRHIAARCGASIAVFATARKIATIIYRLIRHGQAYIDEGAAAAERRYQERRIHSIVNTALKLGLKIIPAQEPVTEEPAMA
jgi:transposase